MSSSATGNFKKGNTVLSSKPFVHILKIQFRGKNCNFCFKSENKLCRCSKCGFVYYCSKVCQQLDWPLHKHECKKLKRLPQSPEINDVLLLARVLIKLQECNGSEESETVGTYTRRFEDLVSHVEDLQKSKSEMTKIFDRYDSLVKYLGEKNVPSFYSILEIFGKILINSVHIEDSDPFVIGTGIYLGASILDHSCEADAEVSFSGTTVIVRSIKDLDHSDIKRVHISYADRLEPKEIRQQLLRENFFFTCTCTRCSNPEMDSFLSEVLDSTRAEEVIKKSRDLIKVFDIFRDGENVIELLSLGKTALMEQNGVLGENHVLRIKMKARVTDFCMYAGRWEEAAELGSQLLDPIKRIFGPFSQQFANRLFITGSAQANANKIREAKKNLREAEKVMSALLGREHSTYKELVMIMNMIALGEASGLNIFH